MLKRNKRIDGRDAVQSIVKEGMRVSSRFFTLIKKPSARASNRYAVVVSKKIAKSAVERNRKRRQVYEVIRLLEQRNPVPSSPMFDTVILLRNPSLKASFGEIQNALLALLNHS